MEIRTERLTLVPCTAEALQTMGDYPLGPHMEGYLQLLDQDGSQLGWGVWLAVVEKTKMVVGDLGFKGKPDEQGHVEIGYGISPEQQGQGFATEAVKGLLHWAFSHAEVNAVTAECLTSNAASIRVLEKSGLQRTGADTNLLHWKMEKA